MSIRAELVVDLAAIRANVRALRAVVRPARYAAVVKANAYGHGLVPVARALDLDVAGFCVYRADEAVELRAAGIAAPILVLGPLEPDELAAAYRARAAIALWSTGAFRREAVFLAERGGRPLHVHAKIDTGVTRLGVDAANAPAALASYLNEPAFDVRGVFTHLAAVEELESALTYAQLERFEGALRPLERRLAARGVIRHAAASAAALLLPRLRLDLVRPGIATYGIWPSAETRAAAAARPELRPALSWRTALVVVREVEAGRSVGYGCSFLTTRPSRIGVLPVGYAEGLPRALSNAGSALVAGRRVPFVGRVCMNMSFVDVTDIPEAIPGAPVTLIGADGPERIDANEIAEAAGTIGYEIVARLPAEVPRRYIDDPGRTSGPGADNAASASPRSIVPS